MNRKESAATNETSFVLLFSAIFLLSSFVVGALLWVLPSLRPTIFAATYRVVIELGERKRIQEQQEKKANNEI